MKEEKHAGGRPPFFYDCDSLSVLIDEYFDEKVLDIIHTLLYISIE